MEELIKELKDDIKVAEEKCKPLKHTDTEYSYWNGVRCQAQKTLEDIKKLNKDT